MPSSCPIPSLDQTRHARPIDDDDDDDEMSLFVDKHRPRTLQSCTYHPDISKRLQSIAQSADFPHLLVYGPSGAGKKTRVVGVLKALYGPSTDRLKIDARIFVTPSNKKLQVNVVSSNYHLELTPSDVGSGNDRAVIQELLKEVAQTAQVDSQAKQRFKVVVINEADALTREAQAALRRTMESYSANLRLILIANSTSKIISPIRSRTLLIRVPAPTLDQVVQVLHAVAKKESLDANQELFTRIALESRRNMRRALLMLEAVYVQHHAVDATTPLPQPDWEVVVRQCSEEILANHTPSQILSVRQKLYDLLSHCIPPSLILKTLAWNLLLKTDDSLKGQVVHWAAFYEHRIRLGSKTIFHLEAFVVKYMRLVEQYLSG